MKKNLKSFLTLAMVGSMLISFAACGSKDNAGNTSAVTGNSTVSSASTSTEAKKDPYKIDVFTMLGNKAGDQTGWYAKMIKDRFNIEMNMIASNVEGGDTKFATMMAAGDLGDIVIFGNDTDNKWQDALKANALLDWTQNGLLDTYGKDITSNYSKAVDKNKLNFGGGKSVYGLGFSAANMPKGPSEGEFMTYQSDMRWDLYEKLGKPAINSPEEMLDVLKKMQELEPKSESGKPTYAFSMWADWDGNFMMNTKVFAALFGYDEGDGFNDAGFLLYNPEDGSMQDALDPNGWYIRVLKLYFKANQMGLVDPDSISQKFEDVQNKYKDGQVLFCWFPWLDSMYDTPERLAAGKGFRFVPIAGQKIISYGFDQNGGNRIISIGAKAEQPDRIMELINWMYTPEGIMANYNGPEGLTWEIKDGKPVLTDFGKKALPNNPVDVPAEFGGGNFKDGQNQMNFENVNRNSTNPATKEPYDYRLWTSYLQANTNTLIESWRSAMGGALTAKDYVVKNNLYTVKMPVFTGKAAETRPDALVQKQGQVATVIKQYSWKLIFAKDQANFDSLLSEMTKKAKGLGYDEVVKWNKDHAAQVYEFLKASESK